MKSIAFVITALCAASAASAQMTINELGPAASYTPTGLPGGGIAQGSFFYIKGTNLGPTTGVTFTGPQAYTIGAELSGTRVRVTVLSTVLDAFPYYTSSTQVNVILPSNAPVGAGTVTVFYNGQQATYPITIVRAAYGIFTLNSAGSGPAVVTNNTTGQVITFTNVLHPGDNAVLWGTGLGAVNFPDNQPAEFIRLESDVSVVVGGKVATLQYAGRTPGLSALDQINFVVPDGVSGCAVPIVVRIRSIPSNFASIPVAASGTMCSDPGGLTGADLAAAQSGNFAIGLVNLQRTNLKISAQGFNGTYTVDSAYGSFNRFDFNSFIRSNAAAGINPGTCSVTLSRNTSSSQGPVILPTYLDAGTKLTLTGNGSSRDMTKSNGTYSASATVTNIPGLPGGGIPGQGTPFLEPGQFTVAGTGGSDVGSFTASLNVPSPLTWTNQGSITNVPRNQDLHITFSGGAASDTVIIFGNSADSTGAGGTFTCYATAGSGSFDVPSYVLSSLPPSVTNAGTPGGILYVGSFSTGTRFNASGINYGMFNYSVANGSNVNFQ